MRPASWRLAGCLAAVAVLLAGAARPMAAQQDTLPAGVGYPRGDARAPLQVIEFSDFGCAYCAQFATQTFPELERNFIATGQVRWTFVPFRLVGFPNADAAAEAAECAGEQQAFWPMHDRLFADRDRWSDLPGSADPWLAYARALGLDTARFTRCTQSREMRGRIHRNTSIARVMGARATPTFFVNGRRVEGALPAARFRDLLLRELAALKSKPAPQRAP
jgi:protein-disulfide isomerase